MNWSDLSMSQRSELMSIYLKNGITSLDEMKKHYNSFAEGGSIDDPPTNINVTTPLFSIQGTLPEDSSLEDRYKANDIAKGIEYAGNYFGSEGFKNRAIKANQKYGYSLYNLDDPLRTQYFPKRINFIKNNNNANAAFNFGLSLYENPIFAGGHETGHHVPLYNTITFGLSDDVKTQMADPNSTLYSPMYHHDYSQIPEEWRNILKPINPENDHNAELSEAYSDLVGLRAVLKDYGIFDSDDPNAVFTQEMLDEFKKQLGSKGNRFLDYHSDENVIRAVNEIADAGQSNISNYAAKGGKLDIPPEEYEKYKYGIPTAEETDNRLYQSSFGTMLPEVRVVAKGDPRKVNNDYYKAHSRARVDLQSRVADRTDYEGLNPINLFEYAPVVGDALDAAHIANDAFNKNYLSAGIGAGMFLLPNIVEKPLKGFKAIPIALSHNIKNNNLQNSLLGRNKSLLNPSMGLGHMKYNSNIKDRTALFFNKELLQEYPNQAYLGDGNTPKVSDFFDVNQLDLISRMSGRKINQTMRSKTGIPLSKLGAGEQIPYEDALQIARQNRAKNDLVNTYNEIKFDGLIPINRSGYAFTDSEDIANMLTKRGIVNNFDFYSSNPEAYSSYETFLNDIVFSNPNYRFKDGGKIFIKPENRGKLDIPPYTQFLNTLPDNLKNSGDEYNMRRYWELNNYPKDFNEGIQLGMFTKQNNGYHANSVAFNPITNSYEFMKNRNHPTYNMELDWYYSDDPEAVEFRKKYKYTPGIGMIPDQYIPIYREGGRIYIKSENRGKFTALKERTGHSASWFKENGTPAQKKMAVFELNSKKWRK